MARARYRALIQYLSPQSADQAKDLVDRRLPGVTAILLEPDTLWLRGNDKEAVSNAAECIEGMRLRPVYYFEA